jgi:threonine dehydratase
MSSQLVSRADVERAYELIRPYVRRTPILEMLPGELPGLEYPVTLKLELLQHAGSFKTRGAFHRVLTSKVPSAGLITASGGNHGAALAHVGATLGYRTEIFVPESSPSMKADRIRALGGTVVLGGAAYDDAQAAANIRAVESGALMVHPFNHVDTVAGAGTCALEMREQIGIFDTVLSATGGGGLTAGTAAYLAGEAQVVSVEPATSCSMAAALAAGRPVPVDVSGLAIDSLGARQAGDVTYQVCADSGVRGITVTDDAIRNTQRALWAALRLVVEPGGAAALAALLSGAYRPADGERVVAIVCGANCEPSTVTG